MVGGPFGRCGPIGSVAASLAAAVMAAEDLAVDDLVVGLLKGMAGSPQADDRFALLPMRADDCHLRLAEVHATHEQQQQIGCFELIEVVETRSASLSTPRSSARDVVVL